MQYFSLTFIAAECGILNSALANKTNLKLRATVNRIAYVES